MSKPVSGHVDPMTEPYWRPSGKTVSKAALKEFSERLHKRMVELGLTQADLARLVFDVDAQGKVKGRDKISLWLRAGGLPGEEKMRLLARALQTSLKELAPPIDVRPVEATTIHDPSRRRIDPRDGLPLGGPDDNSDADERVQPLPDGKCRLFLVVPNELVDKVKEYTRKLKKDYAKKDHEAA